VEGHDRRASGLCTELGFSSFLLLLLWLVGCIDVGVKLVVYKKVGYWNFIT
jgi:hypothetical protein